jgi:uncharacterized protein YyaL (SSP411 family)
MPNRLIHQKSPYLLQHAHNPVDWYPWGEEAFARARAEDKIILLSIGYATCHWCHVMERECFENAAIAAQMNAGFVCVKLDREERPDVDKIYMTAVQAMTGAGGWPLNVFLTPELKPIIGGTYFPPQDRWGRPGWSTVLERLERAWRDPAQRERMRESADHLGSQLEGILTAPPPAGEDGGDIFSKTFGVFKASFDGVHGGFGGAPKFPMPVNLNFLLGHARSAFAEMEREEARRMLSATLRAMARGGIRDHLGGGFARYSTDARWHVPHFEKMLYDNAQLAAVYADAFALTGESVLADVARQTLDYMVRDLRHPEGAFYSAEDADSLPAPSAAHKAEGAFYVWEDAEIRRSLPPEEADAFCRWYGVLPEGNVLEDPHGEFAGKNVLFERETVATPVAFPSPLESRGVQWTPFATGRQAPRVRGGPCPGIISSDDRELLGRAKNSLFNLRSRRPRPFLDDKVITAWNGLALTALCRGAQLFSSDVYLSLARQTALFVQEHLWDPSRGLFRRWREGETAVPAQADDHAFMVQGLLDLFETDFDPRWLEWAETLTDRLRRDFFDVENGGYFMTSLEAESRPPLRSRDDGDNVEPSAGSVAVMNALRLGRLLDREDLRLDAAKTLRSLAGAMGADPRRFPQMIAALRAARNPPPEIIVAGPPGHPAVRALWEVVYRSRLPGTILAAADGGVCHEFLTRRRPEIQGMTPLSGRPAAYLCRDFACRAPLEDPDALRRELLKN